jgi:hypothetical protein
MVSVQDGTGKRWKSLSLHDIIMGTAAPLNDPRRFPL